MLSTEFLITSLIVVMLPGTGVLFTISNGLVNGKSAGFFAALGCTFGIVPHLLASVFGLAALLHTSSVAFQLFKYLGVAYLAFIAWSMWKDSTGIVLNEQVNENKRSRIAVRAFLINILNPKLSIFFLAFLPQFIPIQAHNPMVNMLLLSAVFMLMTFIVFVIYGWVASVLRDQILHSAKILQWLQRCFAGVFVFLGYKLAMAER